VIWVPAVTVEGGVAPGHAGSATHMNDLRARGNGYSAGGRRYRPVNNLRGAWVEAETESDWTF